MMSAIVTQDEGPVLRPLKMLVALIKEDLRQGNAAAAEAAKSAGMPFYRAAGEKMIEAKQQLNHGEFGDWVHRNFGLRKPQSSFYMKLAEATMGTEKLSADNFSSIKDFRRRHLGHDVPTSGGSQRQPAWREDVNDNIERARRDAERIREDTLSRAQEREAEQKLAMRLIDIGYKILVKELHPDKGGSRDAMSRLNRVRDRLKQHA
jgi:hypothetical protein